MIAIENNVVCVRDKYMEEDVMQRSIIYHGDIDMRCHQMLQWTYLILWRMSLIIICHPVSKHY
jgi:hypothetical protein